MPNRRVPWADIWRSGSRGWPARGATAWGRQQALAARRPEDGEEFFQGEHRLAAGEIDDDGSGAQLGAIALAQPTNALLGEPLARPTAIDLDGVEGERGQREPPQHDRGV